MKIRKHRGQRPTRNANPRVKRTRFKRRVSESNYPYPGYYRPRQNWLEKHIWKVTFFMLLMIPVAWLWKQAEQLKEPAGVESSSGLQIMYSSGYGYFDDNMSCGTKNQNESFSQPVGIYVRWSKSVSKITGQTIQAYPPFLRKKPLDSYESGIGELAWNPWKRLDPKKHPALYQRQRLLTGCQALKPRPVTFRFWSKDKRGDSYEFIYYKLHGLTVVSRADNSRRTWIKTPAHDKNPNLPIPMYRANLDDVEFDFLGQYLAIEFTGGTEPQTAVSSPAAGVRLASLVTPAYAAPNDSSRPRSSRIEIFKIDEKKGLAGFRKVEHATSFAPDPQGRYFGWIDKSNPENQEVVIKKIDDSG